MSEKVEASIIQDLKKLTNRKTDIDVKSRSIKNSKGLTRRQRRQRRKFNYYKSLKKVRYNRRTQDLCSAVEFFDITDMDWMPSSCPPSVPSEVVEWQRQDQIAYWKSRAISLEYENQMLRQHLRNVYAKTIEDQSHSFQWQETDPTTDEEVTNKKRTRAENKGEEDVVILPNIPNLKQRTEEMSKLYGEKAQKLMGMETAIQLNYEKHVENSKPVLWPSLPLKLTFND